LENTNRKVKVDEFTFQMLAIQIHVFLENRDTILKEGSVQKYKTGHSNISGYYNAMNKAMDYIMNLSYKLGIYEIMKNKLLQYGKMSNEVLSRVK